MWRRIEDELPPEGRRVLTYGFDAPDSPFRVLCQWIEYLHHHHPYWSGSDIVTHWCYLSDVPTPEDEP